MTHAKTALETRRLAIAIALALVASVIGTLLQAAPASAGTPRTPVWIGAPLAGTWPNADGCAGARYPSDSCSLPFAHHTFGWGNPYVGDWGYDHQSVAAGTAVRLYAAPNDPNLGSAIGARVESVSLACRAAYAGESYESIRRRGGQAVRIGIYHGSTRVGTVTYVHINPSVSAGQWISRWGTQVGTVGSFVSNGCWRGVHLHVELYNDSNYACYNRGWQPGQRVSATNFIGFLGGSYASAGRQACP